MDANEIAVAAADVKVVDRESYEQVCKLLRRIKAIKAEIEEAFAPIISAAHQAHKAAIAARNRYMEPLDRAEAALKVQTGRWLAEQERQRLEAERASAAALEQAILTGQPVAEVPAVPTAPTVEGVSRRQRWDFRIVDESQLPREFLMPNEKAIRQRVQALGAAANIPGVEVFLVESVAVRKS